MAAPMKTPTEAMIIMTLNDAAFEPMAELRKFTASLLTPTERSKIASKKIVMIIPKNTNSIISLLLSMQN
jgi:hypothetical protein